MCGTIDVATISSGRGSQIGFSPTDEDIVLVRAAIVLMRTVMWGRSVGPAAPVQHSHTPRG